jgi:hypothetical protein
MSALAYQRAPGWGRSDLLRAGGPQGELFHEEEVAPAPRVERHLYAVRGTVDEARRAPAPTLDSLLGGAWSALTTGFAACPVCHEETMTARWTAGHGLAGGRCASCGSIID